MMMAATFAPHVRSRFDSRLGRHLTRSAPVDAPACPPCSQILVQHGGITAIINAILAHPEQQELMQHCIHTLDNIATASAEYAAIVISEGGRRCIEELAKVRPRAVREWVRGLG